MLSSLPIVANMPAPAATPTPPKHEADHADAASDGGGFAQALDQANEPPTAPTKPRLGNGKSASRPGADAAHKAGKPGPTGDGAAPACEAALPFEPELQGSAGTTADDGREGGAAAETPRDVSALLADLRPRAAAPAAADATTAGDARRHAPVVDAPPGGESPTRHPPLSAEAWRPAAPGGPRVAEPPMAPADRHGGPAAIGKLDASTDGTHTPPSASSAASSSDAAAAAATALPRFDSLLGAAAAQASAPVAPAPAAPASPAAEATIAAHPASREFGPQLGAALTTFARDGIEHARLHLHPAELGPVQVQIHLDGTQAQVLLGAEHALTREKLQDSLPLLAGSLREAGLTLAGGGVFERQPGNGRSNGGDSRGGNGPRGTATEAAAPVAARAPARSRGVVDLVA
jgi:flagellar hook-length control protein FliK